jgi:hypothetical protein
MNYPIPVVLLLALLACTLAQTPPASQGSHHAQGAFSPAKSLGMFAYPQEGQNSDQQLRMKTSATDQPNSRAELVRKAQLSPPSPPTNQRPSKKRPPATQNRQRADAPEALLEERVRLSEQLQRCRNRSRRGHDERRRPITPGKRGCTEASRCPATKRNRPD